MIKIRLARLGRKKRPFYRIVAINSRSPRDGKFLEILGTYDPLQDPSVVDFNKEKIDGWISKGAQLSNRVQKIIDPEKYAELVKDKPKRPPKKQKVQEEAKAEEAPKEEVKEEAPQEEAKAEEAPKEEVKEEAPQEEAKAEEAPKEEAKDEEA